MSKGRYPANVVLDDVYARLLDAQAGSSKSSTPLPDGERFDGADDSCLYGDSRTGGTGGYGDEGGVSRFFYTSKASRAERTLDGTIDNVHPTVKPVDLMEWLVRLVTAEGQIVLDPFAGSGTTLMACKNTGREFIGIEMNDEYADVARVRAGLTPRDPSVVRGDDAQQGLEQFSSISHADS